jgi:hypothetical protein
MRRTGIRVLALCLIVAISAAVFSFWCGADTSVDRFVADFDRNIARDQVAAAMIARDPVFRARVVRATTDAYASGGWPAAIDKLDALMVEKEPEILLAKLDADDALLVAVWRGYLETLRALRDRPAACRFYASGKRYRAPELPTAKATFAAASWAALAAFKSGQQNLDSGIVPQLPTEAVADALLEKSTELGEPFTAAEWAALGHGGASSTSTDTLFCAAMIKEYANVLALPEAEAVQIIRYEWGRRLAHAHNPTAP